jgi:signal transduction histidine kinase
LQAVSVQLIQADEPDALYTSTKELGVGIYVSRNIVQAHGGRIEAESEVGEGTTFHVWLPKGDDQEA